MTINRGHRPVRKAAEATKVKLKKVEGSRENHSSSDGELYEHTNDVNNFDEREADEELSAPSSSSSSVLSPPETSFSPTKKSKISPGKRAQGGLSYVTLRQFTLLPWSCNSLDYWERCVRGARPLKRGIKGPKRGIGPAIDRPPVDILQLVKMDTPDTLQTSHPDTLLTWPTSTPIRVYPSNSSSPSSSKPFLDVSTVASDGISTFIRIPKVENGGTTFLEWVNSYLLVAATPPQQLLDHPFLPLSLFPAVIWMFKVEIIEGHPQVKLYGKLSTRWGQVRALLAAPLQFNLVATIFSSGHLIIFRPPTLHSVDQDLNPLWMLPLEQEDPNSDKAMAIPCCGAWFSKTIDKSQAFLAVGFTDGHVCLYRITSNITSHTTPYNSSAIKVDCIAAMQVSAKGKPVTSLSFHPEDYLLLAVGLHEARAVLINWRWTTGYGPQQVAIIFSPGSPVTLVRCPNLPEEAMVATDSEGACRLFPLADLADGSMPAVSFRSGEPTSCLDASPWHNALVFGSYGGALHYSIFDMERRSLLIERYFMHVKPVANNSEIDDKTSSDFTKVIVEYKMELPISSKEQPGRLPEVDEAITAIRWCPSPMAPGLLAVASSAAPLVILHSMDRLFLLEP